jgi:dethiobiotin synthetase
MKGFFITGTSTEVGKTVIAAALVRVLLGRGVDALGMKPVESGCETVDGVLVPADGTFLRAVSDTDESIDALTPFRYVSPLAPWAASKIEGQEIEPRKLVGSIEDVAGRHEVMVVEGIGGLLVPITRDYWVRELARDLAMPVIVVASTLLGTLNHTLLTVEHAQSAGLDVAGVVLNGHARAEGTLAEKSNPEILRELLPVPVLGSMPYMESINLDALEQAMLQNLDMDSLLGNL